MGRMWAVEKVDMMVCCGVEKTVEKTVEKKDVWRALPPAAMTAEWMVVMWVEVWAAWMAEVRACLLAEWMDGLLAEWKAERLVVDSAAQRAAQWGIK